MKIDLGHSRSPNILYVFADQLGLQHCGYAGARHAKTPNIDAFAAEAVDLRNMVTSSPVCAATRASLFTGKYATSTGMVINELRMSTRHTCLGQVVTRHGYQTCYIGKWHLYASQLGRHDDSKNSFVPPGPDRLGFDGYWAVCNFNHNSYTGYYHENTADKIPYRGYEPDIQTDRMIRWLEENAGKDKAPFAAVLSYGPPHDPWTDDNVPEEFRQMFRDKDFPNPPNYRDENDPYADGWGRLSPEDRRRLPHWRRNYYAMTANIDWNFGRLMKAVRRLGLEEETLIVFSSDHGECFGAHGRRAKNIFYEEACRVPFLIRCGGHTPRGLRSDACLTIVDVMPTLLGLAGLPIPEETEGMDASHLVMGRAGPEPEAAFLQNNGACAAWEDGYEWRALRDKRHTYAVYRRDGKELLFDNRGDPGQMNDLAGTEAAQPMLARFRDLLKTQMTNIRDTFECCSWYRDHWTKDRIILRTATLPEPALEAAISFPSLAQPSGGRKVNKFPIIAASLLFAGFSGLAARAGDAPPQTFGIGRAGSITLDGKLDDWPKNATSILLGRAADTAPHPGKWEGTPDHSGVVRMAWDERYLYVACDVADDIVLQAHPGGAEPWEGDTMELFLNIHPGPQRQGGFWQIALIPPLAPGAKFAVACPQGDFPDVDGAAEVHPGGYTFECRIPWKNLTGFQPALGAKLGVQIILDDRDAARGRKSLLCWYPSAITYAHPTDMNVVQLREEGEPAGMDFVAGPPALTVTNPRLAPVSILATKTDATAARVAAGKDGEPALIPLQKIGANLVVGKGEIPVSGQEGRVAFTVELLDAKGSSVSRGGFETELIGPSYSEVRARFDAVDKRLKSPAVQSADPEAVAGLGFWRTRIGGLMGNEARPESVSPAMVEQMLVELRDIDAALDRLEAGQDPYAGQTGSFVRAYRSPLTDQFRPHALFVPPGYDPKKTYPLIVLLHGIFGDERALFDMLDQFRGCNAIIYQAASYRQFDWSDISAAETWKGLDEILAKYSVDRDRISLMGWHIGGRGVLQLAMARPGLFAAIAPLYPGIDTGPSYPALRLYPQFYQKAAMDVLIPFPTYKTPPRPEPITNPLERKILSQISLVARAENIAGLPTHLTVGEANPDAAAERLALTARLSELGAPVDVHYVPGAMHGNQPPEITDPEFFRWLLAQRRKSAPEDFTFVVTSLRDNTAWSVRVDALSSPVEPGRVRVIRKGRSLAITTSGVEALSPGIRPAEAGDAPVELTIDGQKPAPIPAREIADATLVRDAAGKWKRGTAPAGTKRHGLSGPIDDFQFDRFVYVYGTQGSEAETTSLEKIAKKFANRGLGAEFPVKADRELTPGEIQSSHLVLIGTPRTNSLLQKIEHSLPLAWEPGGLRLGSNFVAGAGSGACVIYPSPLAPDHYVVVLAGADEKGIVEAWNQRAGVDYALVQGIGDDKRAARGCFDREWKFAEALNLPAGHKSLPLGNALNH